MTSFPRSSAHAVLTMTGSRDWSAEWADFDSRNPGFAADQPVYSLPDGAIAVLARSRDGRAPVLDSTGAKSEKSFTALCSRHKVVGVWRGHMIRYDYLLPEQRPLAADQVPPEYESQARAVAVVARRTAEIHSRLRGVVGWLLTEPNFVRELNAVRAAWEALPTSERPAFPLTRAYRVTIIPSDAEPANPSADSYASDFHDLMDRWGLERLVTWDLPQPQGPLMPSLLPPGAQAMPRHGVHLVLPIHYPLKGDDDLLQTVQDLQQTVARTLGIDDSFAGIPNHRAYERIFRLMHLDRAMRARIPAGQSVNGLVGLIKQAAVDVLKVTEGYVDKLRKGISKCLRGERSQVSWHRRTH